MKMDKLKLIVADRKGGIYPVSGLAPCGMKAGIFFPLSADDLIELPAASELFIMPDRAPIGYDKSLKKYIAVKRDPYSKKRLPCFAVSAFLSPGYTITYNCCYVESEHARPLPLFSYSAVCLYKEKLYTAAMRVDKELRQDLRFMDIAKIKSGIRNARRLFPKNRLFRHLEKCALCYACPAAKNLFLARYEAPLPSSPYCNSRCVGCISHQPDKRCSITQPRIKFVPSPDEIAEVALFHMGNVKDPIVSFGQGCEGEPLMVSDTLEAAIRIIRSKSGKGIINLNTNASKPKAVERLFRAGLNSIRVSINSVQELYYDRYYRPADYKFSHVMESIKKAKQASGFVSINYLSLPGFTDSRNESDGFLSFIRSSGIDMIQLRNLNIDPVYYFKSIGFSPEKEELLGMRKVIMGLRRNFPSLMLGYFNPSRQRISRKRKIS
ncbi:MAG: radical SAM protein [Candidatus Omnitrophica bacterium]|nr:radical SAM protein [Candidatus Omnitrophota bacterium]